MGDPSEREFKEKLTKIRENVYKRSNDIRNEFAKLEKIKVDTLKKTDESENSAEHELEKIEQDIIKSKDLAPESKRRLQPEIDTLKKEVAEKFADLRKRISATIILT